MIVYITFAENYSGIYSGQVIDVCQNLQNLHKRNVKLISIVSLRCFFKQRIIIKKKYKNSLIIPMFPRISNWKVNILVLALYFFLKPRTTLICRNTISANIGIILKNIGLVKKVIFDCRAAEYEQFIEYNLISDRVFIDDFLKLEKNAVLNSDYRLSVSQKLVDYWQVKFNYINSMHTIIPCTLNSIHTNNIRIFDKNDFGYTDEDIVFVYSGSLSGWQSIDLVFNFMQNYLINNNKNKLLILSRNNFSINRFVKRFPSQVKNIWVDVNNIMPILKICDYGLLIRENTLTNKVASPVKFIEYLYAGLRIIISKNVGDYSNFLLKNNCGFIDDECDSKLMKPTLNQREINMNLAKKYFLKSSAINIQKYIDFIINTENAN